MNKEKQDNDFLMNKQTVWVVSTIAGVILIGSDIVVRLHLFPVDYQLIRWAVSIISIVVAVYCYKARIGFFTVCMAISAFLYNPIFEIYLSRENWIMVDFISTMFFFVIAYSIRNEEEMKQ